MTPTEPSTTKRESYQTGGSKLEGSRSGTKK